MYFLVVHNSFRKIKVNFGSRIYIFFAAILAFSHLYFCFRLTNSLLDSYACLH